MKLVTFNINGIRARMPRLLEYLAREQPDVACLQELKCADDSLPIGEIEGAGYNAVWHGQKGFNGVAILTPAATPPTLRRVGLPGDPDDTHSRYIEADVDGLVVGCLYLPNGNPAPGPKFGYKLRWFDRLISYGQDLLRAGAPTVLCGDYNVVPTPIDAVVPRRWLGDAVFFPESRQAYAMMLDQGWIDAIRRIHPEKGVYTYWNFSYGGGYDRSSGLRMDHLLISPSVASRLTDAGVDTYVRSWEKPSDHAPSWIEIE
jgi:exodeoxyribonuclease-3